MQSILLVLALVTGDAVAEAGNSYRLAKQALEAEKYEEAVTLLRAALQQVGDENDQLKYRDDVSRRRHAYYPYYEWGRARLLQSQTEASVFTQRDLLADAVSHLSQSKHPDASVKMEEANGKLKVVQEAIALDGSFSAVKTKIEVLGTNEKFEEAFKEHAVAASKFRTRLKELDEVLSALKLKQAVAIQRYETQLTGRLNDVLLIDPVSRGETIAPMLKPALVPEEVVAVSGANFKWAVKFISLWEKEGDVVKKASSLPGARVIAVADAFDAAGLEALSINLPAGFRAARHLAQAARMGKLRDLSLGTDDVFDTKTAEAVLASSTGASKKAGQAAGSYPDAAMKDTLVADLGNQEKQITDLAKAIHDGAAQREKLTAPIVQAEELLRDGDTLGDTAALAKLGQDLEQLATEATFGTLTPRLRARAFFAKAIAASMDAYLNGKPQAEVMEAARVPATRAYGADPSVDARWEGRLSKKLIDLFEKFKEKK